MGLSVRTNIIILSIVFTILPAIAVALRFWARAIQRAGLSVDDVLIIPGLLFSLGLSINNVIAGVLGNAGGHINMDESGMIVFDDTLTIFLQTEFATQLLSVLSLVFTKLSIVFFYRRLFRGKVFNIISITLICAICAWGVAFFFATLFECMPIEQVWKSLYGTPEHEEKCYTYLPMFIATAITNMCMDVLILTLPLPMVWRLKMPTRQKIAVSFFFLLGAFVVGISIARIYFFYQSSDGFANAQDITYNIAPTLYWTVLEAAIAVICACLPTMRPLVAGISPEAILKQFASKISLLSGGGTGRFSSKGFSSKGFSSKTESGQHDSVPAWDQYSARGSASSQRRFVNTCEAVPMGDLEAQQKPGITVQKVIHQSGPC